MIKNNLIATGDSTSTELNLPNVFLSQNGCCWSQKVSISQPSATGRKTDDWNRPSENDPNSSLIPVSCLSLLVKEAGHHHVAVSHRSGWNFDTNTCFDSRFLAWLLGRDLLPSLCFCSFFLFLFVLGIKPRTWWVLSKCSTIGLYPQPFDLLASPLTGPPSIAHLSNCSSLQLVSCLEEQLHVDPHWRHQHQWRGPTL